MITAVVVIAVVSHVISTLLWLRYFKYLTNLAVARNPVEFVTLQAGSGAPKAAPHMVKRVRPDGI